MMRWINCSRVMKGLISNTSRCLPFVLFGLPVLADVPAYPPQNVPSMHTLATAGNGQVISGRVNGVGYSWDTNGTTIKVDRFQNVNRGAGGLVGTKTNPVNLYDNYGNVARGQIQTQTAMPANSRIAQGLGSIYVLQIANQHLTNLKAQGVSEMYSRGFENGDWAMVADATARLFDWTGFGGNVRDSIWGNPDMQQIQQQLHQQALQQAQQQFQNYQAVQQPQHINPNHYAQYNVVTVSQNHPLNQDKRDYEIVVKTTNRVQFTAGWFNNNDHGQSFSSNIPNTKDSFDYTFPPGNRYVIFKGRPATAQDIRDYNLSNAPQISEIVPKEAEVARLLEQILNDNNRNHTELINALWGAGVIGPGNTQSMVMGSPADNTFLTQPFTPEGSNQAQQTQFIVNNNGSITQNTIQHPDLVANSSQAPTRAEVATQHQQGQQDTRPAKSDSTAEKPDVCAQNPNSLMCAPMGNTDYQDLVLPQQNINIALSPLHIFNTDAACPAPTSFSIAGTQQRMSYEPMCDTARKARPFIIMMAMTAAFLMVFSALNRR